MAKDIDLGEIRLGDAYLKRTNESLAETADLIDNLRKHQLKAADSTDKLSGKVGKLSSFGRNLRQAGGFLGNDTISALGDFADGLGDVGESIDTVIKKGGKLGKITAGLGVTLGGITAGAGIYDATIGKLQGTNSGEIMSRLGQFAAAGFNQNQLRNNMAAELAQISLKIQVAQIEANNAIFDFKRSATKNDPMVNRIASLGFGSIGGLLGGFGLGGVTNQYSQALGGVIGQQSSAASLQRLFGNLGILGNASSNFANISNALNTRKTGAQNSHQAALMAIAQDVQSKRVEYAKQYGADVLAMERQYYQQRAELARNYGIEAQRAEEDHQRSISRMTQDHEKRLSKLADQRDALGIEDEIKNYKDERQRADEDYQVQARRRSEDYANQLQQLEQAQREQERQRQEAYQQQLIDLQAYAAQRRAQEAAEYGQLLGDIVRAFVDARNAFAAQVANTNSAVTNNSASVTQNFNGASGMSPADIRRETYNAIVDVFNEARR